MSQGSSKTGESPSFEKGGGSRINVNNLGKRVNRYSILFLLGYFDFWHID
jgi:hypothetical protein